MSKHTPGPWNRDAIYCMLNFALKNDGTLDDWIEEGKWMPDEVDADLIAAAPELLKTLDWALQNWDDHQETGDAFQGDWVPDARAIITKILDGEQ